MSPCGSDHGEGAWDLEVTKKERYAQPPGPVLLQRILPLPSSDPPVI